MESGGSCLAEGDARGAAGKVEWNAVGSRRGGGGAVGVVCVAGVRLRSPQPSQRGF